MTKKTATKAKKAKRPKAIPEPKRPKAKDLKNVAAAADKEVKATLESLSTKEITDLYNKHATAKVKSFRDKATAVRCTVSLLKEKGIAVPKRVQAATKKARSEARARAPRKISKMQKIRDLFAEKKKATLTEIMDASGFDGPNAQSAMNILKNPNRTKPDMMVVTEYDRATKTYTRVE